MGAVIDLDGERGVKAQIKNWRMAQPEAVNPASFVDLPPEKQVEMIAKTRPGGDRWRGMVVDFTSAHRAAVTHAEELLEREGRDHEGALHSTRRADALATQPESEERLVAGGEDAGERDQASDSRR